MYQSDTEILFPMRVAPNLVELRGKSWKHLVSDVLGEPEASLDQLAFNLLLIRLSGCLTCHTDKKHLVNTKHNLAHSAPGEKNLEGKTVAEAGACSACHLPHKPARKLSGKKDLTTRLCLSCHS